MIFLGGLLNSVDKNFVENILIYHVHQGAYSVIFFIVVKSQFAFGVRPAQFHTESKVMSFPLLRESLRSTGTCSSLKADKTHQWVHLHLDNFQSEDFLNYCFSLTLVSNMFKLLLSFWFNLGNTCIQKLIHYFFLQSPIQWNIYISRQDLMMFLISSVSVVMAPFLFPVLPIWVFSLLISLSKSLLILFIFSKKTTLFFH